MRAMTLPAPVRIAFAALALGLLGACGVNNVPTLEERAKSAWSEVQNQYQRRADLIPNLVETVKGYAAQERDVLTAVTEARASLVLQGDTAVAPPGGAAPGCGVARGAGGQAVPVFDIVIGWFCQDWEPCLDDVTIERGFT